MHSFVCHVQLSVEYCYPGGPPLDLKGDEFQPCVMKNNITLHAGKTYNNYHECMKYMCFSFGQYSLCSIDVQSARVPPMGCTEIRDDKCEYHIVKSDNYSNPCPYYPPNVVG
ncbi:Hypothetical predicted protein [Mytilus galloprovincialis]|uniref:Uncharacterized protein n=1 Tax=Mytilus galloprovincialis TaxID=29158 RepID=A0A8B6HAT3_MYTGA|nr:Hypothetical predicted protein [Mytilus galloprovincialis]